MVLLALLKALFFIVDGLLNVVIPALPSVVTSIFDSAITYIQSGMGFVYTICFDHSVVVSLLTWFLAFLSISVVVDLTWKIINMLFLRNK